MARAFLFYILMAHDVSLAIIKHGQIVGIRLLMLVSFTEELIYFLSVCLFVFVDGIVLLF